MSPHPTVRIMIDLDNTLADYTGALRRFMTATGTDTTKHPMHEPREYDYAHDPSWPFHDARDYMNAHLNALHQARLYETERPYLHAVASVQSLFATGYDIAFVTSRNDDTNDSTLLWLAHHFSRQMQQHNYMGLYMGNKTRIARSLSIDIAIEDNPRTISQLNSNDISVIHPMHPYCRYAAGSRFRSWNHVPLIVKRLLTERDKHNKRIHYTPFCARPITPNAIRGAHTIYTSMPTALAETPAQKASRH